MEISISATINAPRPEVWKYWTGPEHILKWNHASDDWHTTHAENDVKVGGVQMARMEAKDGSMGFDFKGTYQEVVMNELLVFMLDDGRRVEVNFKDQGHATIVTEKFETEDTHSIELQEKGWQAILDNFKKYVEEQT